MVHCGFVFVQEYPEPTPQLKGPQLPLPLLPPLTPLPLSFPPLAPSSSSPRPPGRKEGGTGGEESLGAEAKEEQRAGVARGGCETPLDTHISYIPIGVVSMVRRWKGERSDAPTCCFPKQIEAHA